MKALRVSTDSSYASTATHSCKCSLFRSISAKYSSTCRSSSRHNCVSSSTWMQRAGLLLIRSPRRIGLDGSQALSDNKVNKGRSDLPIPHHSEYGEEPWSSLKIARFQTG